MIFQAVEFGVVAVAPAQLEGHAAEQAFAQGVRAGGGGDALVMRHIVRAFGQRRFGQRVQHAAHVVALYYPAVQPEGRIAYWQDNHGNLLLLKSENYYSKMAADTQFLSA